MSFKSTVILFFLFLTVFAVGTKAAEKYGVFIGINEYKVKPLLGCVNDAQKWKSLAVNEFGLKETNSDLLLNRQATRANIINSIKKYTEKVAPGDVFIMTFSGHGTLFPDSYSEQIDETEQIEVNSPHAQIPRDTYDSAICPIDAKDESSGKPWRNLILDDELFEFFSAITAKGAAVYFISDSCHSGSLARGLGGSKVNVSDFKAGKNVIRRFTPPLQALNLNSFSQLAKPRNQKIGKPRDLANNLLLVLAGSQDNQFSLDVGTPNGPQGLFTDTFVEKYSKLKSAGSSPTFAKVMDETRPAVEKYSIETSKEPNPIPQTPRFDARFFCGTLDVPLFAFPNCGGNVSTNVKVVAKVTDASGNAVTGAALGLLKFGTNVNPNGIRPEDAILLGRSDARGFYDSQDIKVPAGKYLVKVIKSGYQPFIQEVNVTQSADGMAVLTFKLVKQ
jgi:hypothetical protein